MEAENPQAAMEHLATSASADDALPSTTDEMEVAITSDAVESEDGVAVTTNRLRGSLPFLGDEDGLSKCKSEGQSCTWPFPNCCSGVKCNGVKGNPKCQANCKGAKQVCSSSLDCCEDMVCLHSFRKVCTLSW